MMGNGRETDIFGVGQTNSGPLAARTALLFAMVFLGMGASLTWATETIETADLSGFSKTCFEEGKFLDIISGYGHDSCLECAKGEARADVTGPENSVVFNPQFFTTGSPPQETQCFFHSSQGNHCGHSEEINFFGGQSPVIPGTYTFTYNYSLKTPDAESVPPLVSVNIRPQTRSGGPSCTAGNFGFGTLNFADKATLKVIVPDKGQATKLQSVVGDNQMQIVNKKLPNPLVVKAVRTDGQPSVGFIINFSITDIPSGGTDAFLSVSSTQTDSQGLARVELTLGSASGTYKVQASCPNCSQSPNSVTFTATAKTREQATKLEKYRNDFAAPVGGELLDGIKVKAVNIIDQKPEAGLEVVFTLTEAADGSAPQNLGVAMTTATGVAKISFTLGNTAGIYKVKARCESCQAGPEVFYTITAIKKRDVFNETPATDVFERQDVKDSEGRDKTDPDFNGLALTIENSTVTPARPAMGNIPAVSGGKAAIRVFGIANVAFTAELLPVFGTGGHQHDTLRPMGSLSQTTGHPGEIIEYTAGEIAGQEMIVIKQVNRQARDFIVIRETGINIQELSAAATFYRITGNDPRISFKNKFHPQNHYGAQTLYDEVTKLAQVYESSNSATVGINDMSLAQGGLFDIHANWQIGHECHRKGTSVDIDRFQQKILDGLKIPERIKNMGHRLAKLAKDNNIDCRRIVEQTFIEGKKVCHVHFECPASEWGTSCEQAGNIPIDPTTGEPECVEN
ncbi:MAG: hypothetical protein HYT79_08960 [Elusimicrobia bacterium]|nr:hypothetical protein [Elusimicrobiota bacterium]